MPSPTPSFSSLAVCFTVLQVTESWAWDWERGYRTHTTGLDHFILDAREEMMPNIDSDQSTSWIQDQVHIVRSSGSSYSDGTTTADFILVAADPEERLCSSSFRWTSDLRCSKSWTFLISLSLRLASASSFSLFCCSFSSLCLLSSASRLSCSSC